MNNSALSTHNIEYLASSNNNPRDDLRCYSHESLSNFQKTPHLSNTIRCYTPIRRFCHASSVNVALKRRYSQRRRKCDYWHSLDKYTDYAFMRSRDSNLSREFSRSGSLQTSRKRKRLQKEQFNAIKGFFEERLFFLILILKFNFVF